MTIYRVKRNDRAAASCPEPGTRIYVFRGHTFGCDRDDTRATGIDYRAYTKDPDGGYPFFTIPAEDVEIAHD